jgi:hypothetical protein
LGLTVNADTGTKPYTATWLSGGTPVSNPPNQVALAGGTTTAVLRLTNNASPQSLGSANITVPSGYTLNGGTLSPPGGTPPTKSGNTLQLRNLNLAPSASVDVSINVTTPCIGGTPATWTLIVKQANNFSGPPGNDYVRLAGTVAPSTTVSGSACLLRFANQPNTTETGGTIRDGYKSTGNGIRVEIFDPNTNQVVDSDANVSLSLGYNPASGTLTGGAAIQATHGVATFGGLSIDTPGPYKLKASSPAASNEPLSAQFMVSNVVDECSGTGCTFTQTQGGNTYTLTPKKGVSGADFVTTLNLPGLNISCAGAPYFYPDERQPNVVWYTYDDGGALSVKTNVIKIDKIVVQATPENGASKYRVCFASPDVFKDRLGNDAPIDESAGGPSEYFGTPWHIGLLPDCANKNPKPPCVVSWTGDGAGNRIGTFLTPGGDPSYR